MVKTRKAFQNAVPRRRPPKPVLSRRSGRDCEFPVLSAQSLSAVVKQQGARVPAEWLLQLGGLRGGPTRPSGDLDVAGGLLHV